MTPEEREAWQLKVQQYDADADVIQKDLGDWAYEYVLGHFDRALSIRGEDYELVVDDEGMCEDPMQVKRVKDGALFRIDVDVSVWPDREAMKP